ncbi:MAG TPA: sulfur transferase domain-containing protein, partial [Candidatus Sulfotelmatobacter sp.]|nr:sulfur transferase domain-containing protein [Candidatus Sulfotelmatobacter sp.]
GHIPVRMDSITKEDIAAFGTAIDQGPQPVLAHCKGGTRSYLLWALWRVTRFDDDPAKLVAEAAARGVDLRALPATLQRLGL